LTKAASQTRASSVAWSHEIKIHLCWQVLPDPYFHLRGFDWNRCRSTGRAFGGPQNAEFWMEFGFQSWDRRQARCERCPGSPLSRMVASRGACLNRVQGTIHRLCRTHFDNSERPAGDDLCIYCDVGFDLRFSAPIGSVPHPRGAVAKWVAGHTFLRRDDFREIQRSMNAALAKGESGA
jgi:hypothetical protein